VLEFDVDDVDCERNDEIVVFVKVGDEFDENDDCEDIVELDVEEVEIGMFIDDVFGGGDGDEISKISTLSEAFFELFPPPKNILFVDDVDAS
jgi:hypothetical protein